MKKLQLLALMTFGLFSCSQEEISENPKEIIAKRINTVEIQQGRLQDPTRNFENDSIISTLDYKNE